jgi:hypothetical protein
VGDAQLHSLESTYPTTLADTKHLNSIHRSSTSPAADIKGFNKTVPILSIHLLTSNVFSSLPVHPPRHHIHHRARRPLNRHLQLFPPVSAAHFHFRFSACLRIEYSKSTASPLQQTTASPSPPPPSSSQNRNLNPSLQTGESTSPSSTPMLSEIWVWAQVS